MELHLGIMTNAELAKWFGIKTTSFKQTKKKKLDILKDYADFEEECGKINIKAIYKPIYEKRGSAAYETIKDNFEDSWSNTSLDSCARVSLEIEDKIKDSYSLAQSTIYNYTLRSRTELYGKPFGGGGTNGMCYYIWCKKQGDGKTAVLVPLTPEEEEVKSNLIKKYFGNTSEKQIIVKGMVEAGEIKEEEAWQVLCELTHMDKGNFMEFLCELQMKLGCQIVRGTMLEKGAFPAPPSDEKFLP